MRKKGQLNIKIFIALLIMLLIFGFLLVYQETSQRMAEQSIILGGESVDASAGDYQHETATATTAGKLENFMEAVDK